MLVSADGSLTPSAAHASLVHSLIARRRLLGLVAIFTVASLMGTSTVLIRLGGGPPFVSAGWRFGVASVLLLILAKQMNLRMPRGDDLAGAALVGLFSFCMANAFTYLALKRVAPALAQIIATTNPLFTIFLARLQGLDRVGCAAVFGITLSLLGVVVIVGLQGSQSDPRDIAFLALSALCSAESYVIARRLRGLHPVTTVAVAMPIGATVLIILAAVSGESLAPLDSTRWILALLYNIIFASCVMFVLSYWIVRAWGPVAASCAFLIAPVIATALGALVTHERITVAFIAGAALVLTGVYLGVIRGGVIRESTNVV
jgi:drug/metabolite transporter (DMT)-like permease